MGKEKPRTGRPTKYKPEYCKDLIDHMSEGLSYESFAAVISVDRDTLYEWEKVHKEFSDAKKAAFDVNLLFWERQGLDGLFNETEYDEKGRPTKSKSINATVWIFNMKNRHRWRDKQPDEADTVVNNISSLSDDELDQMIDEKMKALEKKK